MPLHWRLLAFRLRFNRRVFLQQRGFLQILSPRGDAGVGMASQMAKQAATSSFIFVIIFHRAPKQATAPTPAIEHDPVQKRLIPRGDHERVVLVRLFRICCAPMQHERFKTKFFQTRANVSRVIGANAFLLHANIDQIVVDRGISSDSVFARKLSRCAVSSFGQQCRFVRIDSARRERHQGIAQIVDRFLVLRLRSDRSRANGKGKDQNRSEIHIEKFI